MGSSDPRSCVVCHEKEARAFRNSPHGVPQDPRAPAAKQSCDTCHGSTESHAKDEGKISLEGMTRFGPKSPTPPEKQNAVCLSCHGGKGTHALWKGSTHEVRGVACANCHSNHSGNPKYLKKATQVETCVECHKEKRGELSRLSHHPIKEGKVQCTDCHNPHGTVADKLVAATYVNNKCYECHTEKRGPFLWQHQPVAENCLTCHTPHGSPHEKLLVAKRPYLCQQCHSNSRHPGTLYALNTTNSTQSVYVASSSRLFYRACQNCHSQIHGSNHPSGKFFHR